MICQDCQHCKTVSYGNGRYTVSCMYNGEFPIHETNIDRFQCPSDSFEERKEEPKTEPPKDNIVVILKSGRDITAYSDMVKSGEALSSWYEMIDRRRPFRIGNFMFNPDDVSAIGYIGE